MPCQLLNQGSPGDLSLVSAELELVTSLSQSVIEFNYYLCAIYTVIIWSRTYILQDYGTIDDTILTSVLYHLFWEKCQPNYSRGATIYCRVYHCLFVPCYSLGWPRNDMSSSLTTVIQHSSDVQQQSRYLPATVQQSTRHCFIANKKGRQIISWYWFWSREVSIYHTITTNCRWRKGCWELAGDSIVQTNKQAWWWTYWGNGRH